MAGVASDPGLCAIPLHHFYRLDPIALEDHGVVIELAKPRASGDIGRVFRLDADPAHAIRQLAREDWHGAADRVAGMLLETLTLIGRET